MRNYQTLQPQENISEGSLGCQSGTPWWMWNHSIVVQQSYRVCLIAQLNLNKQNEGRAKQPCMLEPGTSMIFPENLKQKNQTLASTKTRVVVDSLMAREVVKVFGICSTLSIRDALENSNNQGPQQHSKFQDSNMSKSNLRNAVSTGMFHSLQLIDLFFEPF